MKQRCNYLSEMKMVLGRQGSTATRMIKWPAVAVVAAASSFYTMEYTKNWWHNLAGNLGTTLNALDNGDSSNIDRSKPRPWWKKILGHYQQEEEPSLPAEVMREITGKEEFSKHIGKGVVSRFETNHISANSPIEDRHVECYFPDTEAMFFGIFDGHSGFHCSESLKRRLPIYVSAAVSKLHGKPLNHLELARKMDILSKFDEDSPLINLPANFAEKQNRLGTGVSWFCKYISSDICMSKTPEELLKLAFVTLDRDICKEAIPEEVADESLLAGLSGSCAMASFIKGHDMYFANTGDCRAVMGKRNASGQWKASQITQDQTVENISEVQRIEDQHPNENKTAIQRGRLLGQLQPLRAFGDVQYKWSKELHENVINVVYGRPVVPMQNYLTPPYLIADPVVSHREITNEDKFVILATDGLWEKVSSDHAVKLIGCYLDQLEHGDAQQENGATKLIKYALGKGSDANLANMLSLPNNFKRHFHDDITVTIVYFDSKKIDSKL